jgi:hypothetical protein
LSTKPAPHRNSADGRRHREGRRCSLQRATNAQRAARLVFIRAAVH